ncbi:DUF4190 domain-containing protein [Mycolicibacterium gadium]|uniref:DUF4190 domain-containing protein n=1 Tax=Mycolicibacterium gadium TaxID=1794 RepID=A0A7I7WVE2_MYCGU|nr:DUF4190 domain-containing protein [Mycolicibacterium gadium]BBZ21070.1 hypothetical protein MGAD_54050 [Mycolicibacterium gadium]
MTNPGDDAGQTASSGSGDGASEPPSTSYEAPPIEQSQEQSGGQHEQPTQVYEQRPPEQPTQVYEQRPFEQPGYTPPPAYDPTPQSAPEYPSYPPPPSYGEFGAPAAPGYPPPPPYGTPPPGFGPPAPGFGPPPPPPGYGPPPGFGPPPGYSAAPSYPAYGAPEKTNAMAIGSLVASIVGFCCGIGSIVGIVLGIVAMNQIKQSGEKGHGLAVAGIAVGALSLLINVLWTIGVMAS